MINKLVSGEPGPLHVYDVRHLPDLFICFAEDILYMFDKVGGQFPQSTPCKCAYALIS